MVAVTYDNAHVSSVETPKNVPLAGRTESAAPRKHWFVRLAEAAMEARMRQAEREIRRYTRLMPPLFDKDGNRILNSDANVPFGGW